MVPPDRRGGTAPPPLVSVIIPARDAAATILEAVDSVLAQDYPGQVESDRGRRFGRRRTAAVVSRRPGVRRVANPGRTASAGLAAGLRAAHGAVVARCDAHTMLPPGYLRRAVETLQRTGAANVGGRQRPVGRTLFERAVGLAMTTRLGAGGARYRLGGPEGPVDTVHLGVFRRAALDSAGGFDAGLARNEDYELNWRLRARGGTVWFDPALHVVYRPRARRRPAGRAVLPLGLVEVRDAVAASGVAARPPACGPVAGARLGRVPGGGAGGQRGVRRGVAGRVAAGACRGLGRGGRPPARAGRGTRAAGPDDHAPELGAPASSVSALRSLVRGPAAGTEGGRA